MFNIFYYVNFKRNDQGNKVCVRISKIEKQLASSQKYRWDKNSKRRCLVKVCAKWRL